jgi:hypothetical protein
MARDDVAICLHALYPSVAVHLGDHVEAYEEPDYSRDPFQIPYRDCIQNSTSLSVTNMAILSLLIWHRTVDPTADRRGSSKGKGAKRIDPCQTMPRGACDMGCG